MGALTRGDRRAATGGDGGGAGSASAAAPAADGPSMLESIGGGGDAGLGDAALVDSVYGLNALRAMSDAARLAFNTSARAMAEAAADATGKRTAEAVEALLPPTVELRAVAAGVATALEHLPASLRDSDRCIGLLLEAAGEPGGGRSPASSGEVRILAARRLLEVTAEALHSMDLGEIGSDASMPGFAPRQPQPGVSKTKAAAANGVKKFLNRLLAKAIEVQVVVFAFFMACLEAKIAMAKVRESERGERSFELQRARSDSMSFFSHPLSSFFFAHLAPSVSTLSSNLKTKKQQRAGTFDPGVSKLVGTLVPESESSFGAVVAGRAAETTDAAAANAAAAAAPDELFRLLWRERQPPHRELRFVELRIDRGVSFEAAMARLRAQLPKPHPRARTGFFVSRNRIIGPHFAVLLALVRGYSAPVGAAAAAAEAADAAVAASENEEEEEEEEEEEDEEEAAAAAPDAVAAPAAPAGLQVVGAGANNFYSADQQHQHRLQRQQAVTGTGGGTATPAASLRPPPSKYLVVRANTGVSAPAFDLPLEDLLRIYEPVPPQVAEHYWRQTYERTERGCAHGPGGCKVPNCTNGTR